MITNKTIINQFLSSIVYSVCLVVNSVGFEENSVLFSILEM